MSKPNYKELDIGLPHYKVGQKKMNKKIEIERGK